MLFRSPQAWLTLLWHMGLRLPWSWRLGPSNASERGHALQMITTESFPTNTLFCGDAGFVGYDFWAGILAGGHQFLVRVGSNVHLLSDQADCTWEKRGKQSVVLCWPGQAMRDGRPPLRLRLFAIDLGKAKAWMLTSVLDRRRLTKKQATKLYKMRWGVEVEFRNLKQTMGRAELRCRKAERLLVELDWALMGLAVAELFATKEQLAARGERRRPQAAAGPGRRSLAAALRALRRGLRKLHEAVEPGQELASQLRAAMTDGYKRKGSKKARYRPANPDKKPLGDPQVRPASAQEKQKLRNLVAVGGS